ncbi:MAG: hypothetical protein PW791_14750 [Neorhizobium sp.]|nr:hypothetical protein [Neorhizobium sp.]
MSRVFFATSLVGSSALFRIALALAVIAALWLVILWAVSLP